MASGCQAVTLVVAGIYKQSHWLHVFVFFMFIYMKRRHLSSALRLELRISELYTKYVPVKTQLYLDNRFCVSKKSDLFRPIYRSFSASHSSRKPI